MWKESIWGLYHIPSEPSQPPLERAGVVGFVFGVRVCEHVRDSECVFVRVTMPGMMWA